MDQQFVSSLRETLGLVTVPDSNTIKSATAKLASDFFTDSKSLPSLIHILQNEKDDQIRQLAAVEARKLVPKYWGCTDDLLKNEIRSSMLQTTFTEHSKILRHSSARVVAAIGEIDLANNQWLDLLNTLVGACSDSNVQTKEMAVYILACLLESEISVLSSHASDFLNLFATTLNDTSSLAIRVTSLLALSDVATYIEDDLDANLCSKFASLIPSMVEVLKVVLQEQDTDSAKQVFDVFNNLLIIDNKLVGDNLLIIIKIMLEISSNIQIDEEFRVMALQFLISAVNFRKSKILSSKLGPQITIGALKISSEEVDVDQELNNEDEENENEENAPSTLALRLLSMLSQELPPSQVIQPIFEQIPHLLNSSNTFERRAALLSLGVTSSGAPDYFSTQLPRIIQALIAGLKDKELIVQVASLRAIAQLTSELQDAVAEYHVELFPLIIVIIDSATNVMVYKYATYALDGLIEFMSHEAIIQYLEPLMNKLFHMLQNAESSSLKSAIVSAIGSTAYAGGKAFIPYFENSIRFLEPYISNSSAIEGASEDDLELIAITFENISTMARAVGPDVFGSYAKPLIEASYASLSSDSSRLRESGFAFISNMAKVYGTGFATFLDNIIPAIFSCLEQDEFQFNLDDVENPEALEEEEDLENKLTVHTGITIEKEIAAIALAELAIGTKRSFAPYVESSIKILKDQIENSYGMREAALHSLWQIVVAMYESEVTGKYPIGTQSTPYVSNQILSIIKEARNVSVSLLEEEFELSMVAAILDNFSDSLKKMGSITIIDGNDSSELEKLCYQLMNLLKQEHPCQLDDEEMPSDEAQDSSETDALLFDSTLEVLVHLAETLGADFLKIFHSFKDIILQQVTVKSKVKRVSAIGSLAEIANGLKESNPYTEELLSLFIERLTNDRSLEVRGNAAYGIGILIEHAPVDTSSAYPTILQSLSKLLSKANKELLKNEDGDEETADVINRSHANACGCVSRMYLKHSQSIPLAAILDELLQHLPLEAGFEENGPIFKVILKLYSDNNELILSKTPQIIKIFEGVFVKDFEREKLVNESTLGREENIDRLKQFESEELKSNIIELLKHLETRFSGSVSSSQVLKRVIS
ncbi:hypothetical protein PACTADRAFT_50063 [Pachysolen tannophilus NRRL Y-2460]|uniref:Importin N-terminal domain-containing protein n=1 Tax=Pachysolen tannophilus NRRL Y-2460 TaxID=669874 RepID=A0A1E4TUJ6_PACTA|nr:hypothetical protein PACTADRAFT_50063 [Pachysolen tannophilus NRRL Y-2460]